MCEEREKTHYHDKLFGDELFYNFFVEPIKVGGWEGDLKGSYYSDIVHRSAP
jgi:hypothetical protein